ncbi:hypothetical protein EI545_05465 [Tabrizicola piscis]|uniref:Uncharacterized protein n=1 Tax=Tabrizicola piscis TaxID=2494374 RepID=A0A3S8U3Z6_9RHOB|nr:hypothetical protein [Tabrizicola piscis]AZL58336.1 hypothetical protein EI545_05465 [Tabrizicola piscis]
MNVLSFPTLGVTLFNIVGESILLAKLVEDIRKAQRDGEEDLLANSAIERIVAKLMPKSLLHGTPRYPYGSKLFAAVASELELNGTAAAWVPLNASMRLVTARIVDRRGQKYKLAHRSM